MAVHIRLSRAGAKKRPFYRIIVADHRSPRGGRFLENIGTYDPTREPVHFAINQERLAYWRARGALPSDTVDRLIKRQARAAAQAGAEAAATSAAK
ncbi:MAG TPA: 30S ribosomal protein S16 [Polyangiaceae bacterium]|nr:30S ribosomal protein S16 [Polyangiaceae bacterium]